VEIKKHKINLFDIVVILFLIAAAVVGYKLLNKETVSEMKTIRYTIELSDNPVGFSENINVGDDITDNIKNYYMGKVVDIKTVPYTDLIPDTENGVIRESVIPDRETNILTLEAQVVESGSDFKVNGYYVVRCGLEVAAKGNGYAGRGYILDIER